ncbi:thiol-disulfide oxidoreductase DCC family protein [Chitinophaga lutea]|uniref:Thiol-disulfide oxidoreductase DCC family protein n=1 Tax=Chitinophaga lutea TaxID=2488634 RepID=A0A3N4PJ67_9BACT|nr:thiol-disulfide oxidoreductase DCC family protein [Chitinophaga lutea]RPE08256.1 thiol-disulfide oxidoreductase DCC family protein [Chitinophaga lutea]
METATILFDGVCLFCNASVNFVLRRDRYDRFRFAPLQSPAGEQLLVKYGLNEKKMDSFVLIENDQAFTESTAVLRVARRLGFPWSLAWGLMIVPAFIRNGVYRWIARNRYKWFGKNDQCMVPDEKVRSKFL